VRVRCLNWWHDLKRNLQGIFNHREDEWYYVLAGQFLFEVGGVNIRCLLVEVSGHHGIFRTFGRKRVQPKAGKFLCTSPAALKTSSTHLRRA
jgi:hypothetical protein